MKARALLRMFVKYNINPHIKECKTSSDTWETFKGLCETLNKNTVIFLKSKFPSIKMEKNENIIDYMSRTKDLKDKLSDFGEKV